MFPARARSRTARSGDGRTNHDATARTVKLFAKLNLNLFILQAAVVTEGVARWEDNKKWQQKVETLRGKLAEKTRELEKAEKTITMLRDAVSRAEKDKAGLHNRLKRYYFNETNFSERFTCDTSLFFSLH